MPLYIDLNRYRDIRLGDKRMEYVYLGNKMVWKRNSPPSVSLSSPAVNATNLVGTNTYATDKCLALSWNGSDPDNDTITYTCWLGTSTGTATAIYTGTGTSVTVNVKRGTTYWWRVTAVDSCGQSAATAWRKFTTANNVAPTVSLISPVGGTVINGSSITFKYSISDSNLPADTLWSRIRLYDANQNLLCYVNTSTAKGTITAVKTGLASGQTYYWDVDYSDDYYISGNMTYFKTYYTSGKASFKTDGVAGLALYSQSMPLGHTHRNTGGSDAEGARVWAFLHPDGSLAALIGAIRADNYDGWARVDTFASMIKCSEICEVRSYSTTSYRGNITASNLVTHLQSVASDYTRPYWNGWTKGRYIVMEYTLKKKVTTVNTGGTGGTVLPVIPVNGHGYSSSSTVTTYSLESGKAYGPCVFDKSILVKPFDTTIIEDSTGWHSTPSKIITTNLKPSYDYYYKYVDTLSSDEQSKITLYDALPAGTGLFTITTSANSAQPGSIIIRGRNSAGTLGIFCVTFYKGKTSSSYTYAPPSISTLLAAFKAKYGSYVCWND